jgi:uncharacterized protein (TIGR03437 family)
VITIYVTGVGNVTKKVSAGNPPLPTKLGGISAALLQGGVTTPAPIFAVFPFNACTGVAQAPCGSITGVTLQIPFELHVHIPGTLSPEVLAYLQVSDDAGHTASALLDAKLDQIHVLHMQDTVLAGELAQQPGPDSAAVTHLNGKLVTAANPAHGGEKLVMYAVGLGAANPPVKSGAASPTPAAVTGVGLSYYPFPNMPPWPGFNVIRQIPPLPEPVPSFVGLTPGFVGLYQVNFVLPPSGAGLVPCDESLGVFSNLTVTLIGHGSFDGAAICVAAIP